MRPEIESLVCGVVRRQGEMCSNNPHLVYITYHDFESASAVLEVDCPNRVTSGCYSNGVSSRCCFGISHV